MTPELQDNLTSEYSSLFSTKNSVFSHWGIECNDGWFDILDVLMFTIKWHQKKQETNKEYIPIKIDQIKEKFGSLRFYYSGGDDYVHVLSSFAESLSSKVCEICGDKGSIDVSASWLRCRCENHNKKQDVSSDIINRLNAYAEVNEITGAYTEAKCIHDAIHEIKKLRLIIKEVS